MCSTFEIKNVLRVKGGYFKKSPLINCTKMRILKMRVPLFELASCNILSISSLSMVHETYVNSRCKKVVMSFDVLKIINIMQVAC